LTKAIERAGNATQRLQEERELDQTHDSFSPVFLVSVPLKIQGHWQAAGDATKNGKRLSLVCRRRV
jgi:hypothetical protein